jgi:sporulation protein YlmC with PRC-barrel domain
MPVNNKIKQTDPEKQYRQVMSASSLSGDAVRNEQGEDLGKISEIMLDVSSGRVAYAVLSFGGFLGMGDKLFAVPWNALTLDEDEKCFILDVDKQTLENAPGFDKDNWPDMADTNWRRQIYNYYKTEPYWDQDEEEEGVSTRPNDAFDTREGINPINTRRDKTFRGGGGM